MWLKIQPQTFYKALTYRTSRSFLNSCLAMASTSTKATVKQAPPKAVGRPAQGPSVELNGKQYTKVTEGTASILFEGEAFYNPVQEFNRDMSIAVVNKFAREFKAEKLKKATIKAEKYAAYEARMVAEAAATSNTNDGETPTNTADVTTKPTVAINPDDYNIDILEALSATGLRSIRYFNEIANVNSIIANDFSQDAVDAIRRNVEFNGLNPVTQVVPNRDDASALMYRCKADPGDSDARKKTYAVIDLDPYGSAAPFLDSAVQTVENGGLLCITCTDMAVLAGNHPEACYAKYGSMPLRGPFCLEMGLRIVLGSVNQHAARYKRYIVPMMSCSIDFYCRIFVRVYESALEVKRSASKMSHVYSCTSCDSFYLQPVCKVESKGNSTKFKPGTGPPMSQLCKACNKTFQIGGPIWSDPIHNVDFVTELLAEVEENSSKFGTFTRMKGFLNVISEELSDCPLYYTTPSLSNTVHCRTMRLLEMRSAIMNLGFKVSSSHANKDALKTNAPPDAMWDILRSWVKLHPVKDPKPNTAAAAILAQEPTLKVSFERIKEANPASRAKGISRFPPNPEANWGPKARAKKRHLEEDEEQSKKPKIADKEQEPPSL
eukprot:m.182775 g.182775  ORF g.182775 m.182775 type:complete len:606 (+) comp32132_c0_seq1:92-1909(+)